MEKTDTESFKKFEKFIAGTGDTYAFDGESSVRGSVMVTEVIRGMGLDPMNTDEFRKGILAMFNVEVLNMPDLGNSRLIFAPNHVSDFDALVLGVLHPKIRIVSKDDWTNNEKLRIFLDAHYDLYGFDRSSVLGLRAMMKDALGYFESGGSRHYLIFGQGTISDFNKNSPERISAVAQKISVKADVPVVAVFMEQVSLHQPTRIVFDKPMQLSKKDDFRELWLEREKALQSTLTPPARAPKLSYQHAHNNKPGDPFFSKKTKTKRGKDSK